MENMDGILLVPLMEKDENEKVFASGMSIEGFRVKGDHHESIEQSEAGSKYHVVFFTPKNGELVETDNFEAIFSDPITYARGLAGLNMFGFLLRKTAETEKFLENHRKKFLEYFIINYNEMKKEGLQDAGKTENS
jgi:hypothetical protein